ncbi:MAG: carbonate dehydratase [Rhodoferax sp.]|nr:carbonate dehydratase [Rhodoferax sp.]
MIESARLPTTIDTLLERNRAWSSRMQASDSEFFSRLAHQQTPQLLWIGCSDSRVAANQILDLAPGEVFTHRNIANIVASGDMNCLSVLQFATDILQVRHIAVVGHYGCSGIRAAVGGIRLGLVDNWLGHIHAVHKKHAGLLLKMPDTRKPDAMCELNVAEQFSHVCQTHIVRDAWARGQQISVHGWVYGIEDGLLRKMGLTASSTDEAEDAYCSAIESIADRHRIQGPQPVAG